MSEHSRKSHKSSRGINKLSAGWGTWKWLSGVSSKEKAWLIGSINGRGGYEAWMAHLTKGLQESNFLLRFEAETDPWSRSRLVGQRIGELRKTYRAMSDSQRAELAEQTEIELKTGLEILGKDKRMIQELISLVDCPTQ
jgi:hypothetical protein